MKISLKLCRQTNNLILNMKQRIWVRSLSKFLNNYFIWNYILVCVSVCRYVCMNAVLPKAKEKRKKKKKNKKGKHQNLWCWSYWSL